MISSKIKNYLIPLFMAIVLSSALICTVLSPYYYDNSDEIISIIPSEDKNDMSLAYEIRIASIEIDGRQLSFKVPEDNSDWDIFNNFLTHFEQNSMTPYVIDLGKSKQCTITFVRMDDSGIVNLLTNNTEEIIDLYSNQGWELYKWTFENSPTFSISNNNFLTFIVFIFCLLVTSIYYKTRFAIIKKFNIVFSNKRQFFLSFLVAISLAIIFAFSMYYSKNYKLSIVGNFNGDAISTIYWDNGEKDGYLFSGGNNFGKINYKRNGNKTIAATIIPKDAISKMRIDFNSIPVNNAEIIFTKFIVSDFYNYFTISPTELLQTFNSVNGASLDFENSSVKVVLNNSLEEIPYIYTHDFQFHSTNRAYKTGAYIKLILIVVLLIPFIYAILSFIKSTRIKETKIQLILQLFNLQLLSMFFHYCMIVLMQSDFQQAVTWILDNLPAFLTGSLILYLLCLLIWGITKSTAIVSIIIGVISYAVSIVNHYKIQYQGKPLAPWDFLKIKEVRSISAGLRLEINEVMILIFFLLIIGIIINSFWPKFKIEKTKSRNIITASVLSFVCVFGAAFIYKAYWNSELTAIQWDQNKYYKENGVINSFLANCRYISIKKPDNYSKATIDQISNGILSKVHSKTIEKPDIIVIMSEGFWDITDLNGITFNEDLLPNLNAIKKESFYGYTLVPVFGGGTSNTEWEALTGFSKNYLPSESTPYQQYISGPTFSIARYLKEQGYSTVAMHPHFPENWNRNTAYPYLGFDTFLSLDDFENPTMERNLVSDYAVTDKIISEYENHIANSKQPLFTFAVTVQNHVSYNQNNYDAKDQVKFSAPSLSEDVINDLKDFATGIHHSDEAFGELIHYFKSIDREVIIVFFGDHMTTLGDSTYKIFEETGYISNTTTDLYKTSLTPLIIWSNYRSKSVNIGIISSFQIMPTVFQEYSLLMPPYFELLCEIQEVSKGYTNGNLLDSNSCISYSLTEQQKRLYDMHWLLQYDMMFGEQYSKTRLFK